ncbi:MAG: hypothetical protein OXF79_27875 [Chloroflexi bacterium]|nr:hypothetical protein [Chloroflexota bacterium]
MEQTTERRWHEAWREQREVGEPVRVQQLAEVEPGLVDIVVVVLDEADALAHHALAECVYQLGIALVVSDGGRPAPLIVPGQGLGEVGTARRAHGGGERGEGGLRQQALVVAPGGVAPAASGVGAQPARRPSWRRSRPAPRGARTSSSWRL